MSLKFQDAQDQAKVFLRGQGKRIAPADWVRVLEQARIRFSKDKPRELVFSITGTGASLYTLTGIATGWVNKFSFISKIEYPYGAQKPSYISNDKWELYRPDNTNEKLKLYEHSPTASQTMLLSYSVPHTLSDSTSTIEDNDVELFSLLAAHYAAQAMVSDLLQDNRSNLQADTSDFSQKQNDMQALADKLLAKYVDSIKGKTGNIPVYTTAIQDYDMFTSLNDDFAIHGKDNNR